MVPGTFFITWDITTEKECDGPSAHYLFNHCKIVPYQLISNIVKSFNLFSPYNNRSWAKSTLSTCMTSLHVKIACKIQKTKTWYTNTLHYMFILNSCSHFFSTIIVNTSVLYLPYCGFINILSLSWQNCFVFN